MKRAILDTLLAWKAAKDHKPLLLRGARQVGKTFIVEELGKSFPSFVSINLESELKYRACFGDLSPKQIVDHISLMKRKPIIPGETLLFIDEIQAHPKAIESLRYFREQMPELHVIAAGSLLEFVLNQESMSMPVGRIEYIYMYPCTFDEFLLSVLPLDVHQRLAECSLQQPLSEVVHNELLDVFKTYMAVGGMPEAVSVYESTHQIYDVQRVQRSILQTYRDDFGKYSSKADLQYLHTVFDKTPGMVGSQIRYHKINPDFRSRELKQAIQLLEYAGIVKRIISTSASGLPLVTTANEKKFKLQFLDIGLVQCASELGEAVLRQDIQQLNNGGLAEQVVGQLLLSYQDPFISPNLFYWARDAKSSSAEVDFVINVSGQITPVEVKFGASGHLKSLHALLKERNLPFGVKISAAPLSYEKQVLNIPFYLIGQLPRLCKDMV
jgi:uncharacterized protein